MYTAGKIAYLGNGNSYSHAAASMLVKGELVGYDTMSKVVRAVKAGEADMAVLPIENNVEGAVNEVFDMLADNPGLYILRQLVLPVRHSLIVKKGTAISDIRRVRSHPQAIGQCRNFLSELPVTVEAVSSTSQALSLVDGESAAIAFRPLAGQEAIRRGIQDSALNATRFALLSPAMSLEGGTVSVSFDLANKPGALLSVLGCMGEKNVNMTRILSRPHRSGDGDYRFFVDFDYTADKDSLNGFLSELAVLCADFCFLGRYDVELADNID